MALDYLLVLHGLHYSLILVTLVRNCIAGRLSIATAISLVRVDAGISRKRADLGLVLQQYSDFGRHDAIDRVQQVASSPEVNSYYLEHYLQLLLATFAIVEQRLMESCICLQVTNGQRLWPLTNHWLYCSTRPTLYEGLTQFVGPINHPPISLPHALYPPTTSSANFASLNLAAYSSSCSESVDSTAVMAHLFRHSIVIFDFVVLPSASAPP